MCDLWDGETCQVWSETLRQARKAHKCDSCDGAIKPGEHYLVHFNVYDRYVTNEKMCWGCTADRAEFAKAHEGFRPVPSSFTDYISQCIDEEDLPYDEEKDEYGPSIWEPMLERVRARRAVA